jgi:hypothetical protein
MNMLKRYLVRLTGASPLNLLHMNIFGHTLMDLGRFELFASFDVYILINIFSHPCPLHPPIRSMQILGLNTLMHLGNMLPGTLSRLRCQLKVRKPWYGPE